MWHYKPSEISSGGFLFALQIGARVALFMIKHISTILDNTWVDGFLNTETTFINIKESQITFVGCQNPSFFDHFKRRSDII